jgi:UDP-2,3-diacylglucosamine pyrophosphatase LpxH
MKRHARFRAVFISDLHLGASECRARDAASLLKRIDCDSLYLVGDIVDMWRLRQRWHWPESNNRFVHRLLKLAKRGTRVVFIPGNHDEPARRYAGLSFGGVQIALQASHTTADGRKLLITHGDQFDLVVLHAPLLSALGGWAYDVLLVLNRHYNRLRALLGRPYWSFSQFLKLKVKRACSYISRFEDALLAEAARGGYDGVVCGHIHKAELREGKRASPEFPAQDGGKSIAYFNCGDWVESCTLIVEHDDGAMELIDGLALLETLRARETPKGALTDEDDVPASLEVSDAEETPALA